jgi:hypothetical protein
MITGRACWLHVMENSPSTRTSIVRSITNEGHNWVKVLRSKRLMLGSAENSARQVANICSDYRSQRVRYDDHTSR